MRKYIEIAINMVGEKCVYYEMPFSDFRSGFQMSEMFYTFGELDERVRPLVFFIRTWAKEYGIIQPYPSLSLSNFMLTCMVIFFLQTLPKPILPPSDTFVQGNDASTESPALNFITDNKILTNFKSENTDTLSELVVKFFDYYLKFNFNDDGISITNGAIQANIAADSIYIYNPLESGVNVCRNLSDFERNQFIEKCKLTHRAMTAAGHIDAVDVLELWSKKGKTKNLDAFVSGMVKSSPAAAPVKNKSNAKDKQSNKFDVRTLMKGH